MTRQKIEIKKQLEVYKATIANKETIFVEIRPDEKTISLKTKKDNKEFVFLHSNPDRVERIAKLFLEAVKLIKS